MLKAASVGWFVSFFLMLVATPAQNVTQQAAAAFGVGRRLLDDIAQEACSVMVMLEPSSILSKN